LSSKDQKNEDFEKIKEMKETLNIKLDDAKVDEII
jgi:hypothetical protein